jgi:hypothetical protein
MRPFRIGSFLAAAAATVGALGTWTLLARAGARPGTKTDRTPIVVELFSSEGCSSCPPADAYLATLDTAQPLDGVDVIALEFHVDYWDDIGWKDPYSNREYSDRQYAYAHALPDHRVYTPELVVQGRFSIAPGDGARVQKLSREHGAKVIVRRQGSLVHVSAADVPASKDEREVWLAVTERGLRTRVTAGENRGRTLAHAPVVRRFVRLGTVSGATYEGEKSIPMDASWDPGRISFVALVQEHASRKILGAGTG